MDIFFIHTVVRYNKKEKKIISDLKQIIGFKPKHLNFYKIAFIHKSATFINHKGHLINNERLEFLGDAILDAVVGDYLFQNFPEFDEGKLTQTRSKLVNTNQLSYYNKKIGINKFLETHTQNTLNEKHLYADTLEAFIGAIFLDKGFKKTYSFIENKLLNITNLNEIINTETNHKSRLIELSQKKNYKIFFDTKIKDKNTFVAKILKDDKEISQGFGKTKKDAEQDAALNAMVKINPNYNNGKKKHTNKP